mgnify:CR=1 FL=1|jgi:hypothetical protein
MDSNPNVDDVFAALEKAFSAAVRDGVLPGAVLTATNGNGSFHFAKAFGNNGFTGDPLTTKSIMAIAYKAFDVHRRPSIGRASTCPS